ncbi:MAG: hypothetical protein MR981_05400 [Ruminococcus bromii]|jgi:predicted nucleic acid-binding Zn ribbon protein/uncharacterized protein YjeT (DUF2065 family)|uniref:hypothetical protein n=1 Tax=Ruminococcus sp. YE282 TaxID=3158780 RepID=UPI000889754F|nr:hypothetical protein [Ruminococcus bromii]MCI7211623.1 hypothetical protein [Ruminococcus bromii]MDD6433242.1 hypothetical protein [Ruminococcus bromii]MDY4084792.1 hypothetical protein [Ruminococcus bromii]MDY4710448.1 hypothetical protein [Ruminococcus bromii]
MKKCDYCAKEITYFEQYCSDECQRRANKYYETSEKYGKLFSVINVICVFGIPVGLFLFPFSKSVGTVLASVCCVVLGIMLLFLPFPTEGMISKLKLQKSMKITRIIGASVIALGFLIIGFYFFFFS